MMGNLNCLIKRSTKIEGKDIGAILGFDNSRTITDVFEEKTMKKNNPEKCVEAKYWINTLEEVISREFMLRTKKKIRKNNINSIDSDYEFMTSNVNRKIIGENSILDCIVINGINEKDIEDKEFYRKYMLQAQHNMQVRKADKSYIAMLINGKKLIMKEVNKDEKLITKIIIAEENFWKNYIEKNIKPIEPLKLCSLKKED